MATSLRELERMSDHLADFRRHAARAVRTRSVPGAPSDARRRCPLALHGRIPQTPQERTPRAAEEDRAYTLAELDAIVLSLLPTTRHSCRLVAARWAAPPGRGALERRDVDRAPRHADRSRDPARRLAPRGAAHWAEHWPRSIASPRGWTRRCSFPPPMGPLSLHNFRRRKWNPRITSSGIASPPASTTCARRSPPTRSPRA